MNNSIGIMSGIEKRIRSLIIDLELILESFTESLKIKYATGKTRKNCCDKIANEERNPAVTAE